MRVRSAPNALLCGCQLGPVVRFCRHAKAIERRRQVAYRLTVANPYDARASRQYTIARDQLDSHWERNGASELSPGPRTVREAI